MAGHGLEYCQRLILVIITLCTWMLLTLSFLRASFRKKKNLYDNFNENILLIFFVKIAIKKTCVKFTAFQDEMVYFFLPKGGTEKRNF